MILSQKLITAIEFFGLSAIWGSVFLLVHIGLETFVPEVFIVYRLVIACGTCLSVFLYKFLRDPQFKDEVARRWRWILIPQFMFLGLTNQAIPYTLVAYATTLMPSGLVSLMISSQPFFMIAVAAFIIPEEWQFIRTSRVRLCGLLVGFIGVALVLVNEYEDNAGSSTGNRFWGVVMVLGTNFSFAIAASVAKRYIYPIPTLLVLNGQLHAACLIMTLYAAIRDAWVKQAAMPVATSLTISSLLICGFISSALAFFLFFELLRNLGAVRMNMVNFVVPVFGVLLGLFVLGEFKNVTVVYAVCLILGSIMILTGVILVSFSSAGKRQSNAPSAVNSTDAADDIAFQRLDSNDGE
eukprot:ANDGO_06693.mRNA.1 putative transporter YoaV